MRNATGASINDYSSSSSSGSGSSGNKNALERHHDERAQQLDAYFARTRLLEVVRVFVHELAQRFATQRLLPRDPYPALLMHLRLAEVHAAELLLLQRSPSDATALAPQQLLVYDGQDAATKQLSRALPLESQVVTFAATTSPQVEPWGLRGALERVPFTRAWQRELERLHDATPASLLLAAEYVDDGNRVRSLGALVGSELLLLGRGSTDAGDAHSVEIERHVIVHGDQLEKAMTAFARQLIKTLHDLAATASSSSSSSVASAPHGTASASAAASIRLLSCRGVCIEQPMTPATLWPLERMHANRAAFVAAVKMALVANGAFVLDMLLLQTEEARSARDHDRGDGDRVARLRLRRCTCRFFFHFHAVAPPAPSSTTSIKSAQPAPRDAHRSFLHGSRVQTTGVLFQSASALELALQLHAAAVSASSASTVTPPSTKHSAGDTTQPDSSSPLDDLVACITRSARCAAETRHWLALAPTGIAFRLAQCVAWTDFLLAAVDELASSSSSSSLARSSTSSNRLASRSDHLDAVLLLRAPLEEYARAIERVMHDAAISASSSLLVGVAGVLRAHCALPSSLASLPDAETRDEMVECLVESLQRSREALLWLAGAAVRDVGSLVARSCGTPAAHSRSPWTSNVADMRVDIAASVEQRRYPPAVVAECVLAQYVADACVDVALESAVMHAVAFALPPNPFIDVSTHVRVFAARQRLGESQSQSQSQSRSRGSSDAIETSTKDSMSVQALGAGRPGFALPVRGLAHALVSANERLLRVISGERVRHMHQQLTTQQLLRPSEYHPSKASYSARIFPSLLLLHPLATARLGVAALRMVEQVDVVEHVVIEGSERAQALWFFADAVRRDVQRLLRAAPWVDAPRLRLLGPQGDELTAVELQDVAMFEQLLLEATPKQCVLQIALAWAPATAEAAVIYEATKIYAFHFVATDAVEPPPARRSNDTRSTSSAFGDVLRARVWRFGVFFSEDTARLALGDAAEPPDVAPELLTPHARQATELDDALMAYELQCVSSTAPSDHARIFSILEQSSLLQLMELETALEWLLERLPPDADADYEDAARAGVIASAVSTTVPRHTLELLRRIAGALERHVLPLAEGVGCVDVERVARTATRLRTALSTSTGGASAAGAGAGASPSPVAWRGLARRAAALVALMRAAWQRDVFAGLETPRKHARVTDLLR